MSRIGTQQGIHRRATIRKYNSDGSVTVSLNDASATDSNTTFDIPLTSTWITKDGGFIGGYPSAGSTVSIAQGAGGQWYIINYLSSKQSFDDFLITSDTNALSELKPNRALIQVAGGTRLFADPKDGIQAGNQNNYLHIDTNRNIISDNFNTKLSFTEASRHIQGVIKRDVSDNVNRNITSSTLDSTSFDSTLTEIGMDSLATVSMSTIGNRVRNVPLVESRSLIYEFANSYDFTNYKDEFNKYEDISLGRKPLNNSRRDNRADLLSLTLEAPNQLIESVSGTVVDSFGNILDINRNILPIGKIDDLSLTNNSNKSQAFSGIRTELRKSIAYHWELNARKSDDNNAFTVRDVSSTKNYSKDASRLFVDIDKEGQFKINIPASSETGNIPLLTRYENFSTLQAKKDNVTSADEFLKSDTLQDIFLENFAGYASIKLSSTESLADGYAGPIDRITETFIKFGTAYHDITKALSQYQPDAPFRQAGYGLVDFDPTNHLNKEGLILDDVVSDTLIVSGDKANAGGRSGVINLDGFLALNIGSNTVDRQSLWLDTSGGVVATLGRDKRGISYAANLDGDMIVQVGGPGISNKFDDRFKDEDDGYRNGTVEFRVFLNGQPMIFKLGPKGIDIVSPGTITMTSQQDFIIKSNASLKFEAENIVMHAETSKRIITKWPNDTI